VAKLTLSVDDGVVTRAKQYAKLRGVSVSHIVEAYLAAVAEPPSTAAHTPVLRSVRGLPHRASIDQYREHLVEKYR
jgi:hypothetical protein